MDGINYDNDCFSVFTPYHNFKYIMIFSIIHMHVHKNNTSIHCVVCISQLPCFEASVDVYRCVLSGIIILCIIYACL